MSNGLKAQLAKARPSLRLAAPMSFFFIMLMGVFNIILGSMLWYVYRNGVNDNSLHLITSIIPIQAWATGFVLLGMAKLYSLRINSWEWSRNTLLIGVGLKSGWAVALIIKTLSQADNVFITLLWITLAITQVLCYIFFLPPHINKYKGDSNG